MPGDDNIYGFNKDDTIELINLIGNSDNEFPDGPFRTGGGGGSSTSLYKATMNEPWSAGVAECSIYTMDGVTYTDTTTDADVYDGLAIFSSLTTGDSLLVLRQAGKYYAIQAPCP